MVAGRSLFQTSFFHRLVGARGSASTFDLSSATTNTSNPTTTTEWNPQDDVNVTTNHSRFGGGHLLPTTTDPIFLAKKESNFGQIFQTTSVASAEIAKHKVVFFGEIHSRPPIIAFQRSVQDAMAKEEKEEPSSSSSSSSILASAGGESDGTLHVVFEHFSFDMQEMLDSYLEGTISFDDLVKQYKEIGTEGHDLEPYRDLLEDAKQLNLLHHQQQQSSNDDNNNINCRRRKVQLHAGFLSRKYARLLMKEGDEKCFQSLANTNWLPPVPEPNSQQQLLLLTGTDQHYNIFESMLTGRSLIDETKQPIDQFRRIFKAQILKDVAMAHKINTLIEDKKKEKKEEETALSSSDKILVLVGNGHVLGYSGVPERFLAKHPELAQDTCVLVSHRLLQQQEEIDDLPSSNNSGDETSFNNNILNQLNTGAWGPSKLSDYIYVYQEQDEQGQQQQHPETTTSSPHHHHHHDTVSAAAAAAAADSVKEETRAAYDKVGESAHLTGNTAKAIAIMKAMFYNDDQIETAGDEIYNFQGVGNPHIHANIQPGETVLDIGSGLGIDSFIAQEAACCASRTGATGQEGAGGFVLGIDISNSEVRHAQRCARRRKLDRIRFTAADMEQIPLPDNSVDVVISNGAFCLAPDKEKAFREVFRVLKPGGRISICTTTTQDPTKLEPGVSWPVCMQMFIPKNDIVPMCQRIGYVDVMVDDSDSSMSMELPVEVLQEENTNPQRSKVHVGSAEFRHLEEYDMDALCARVCVVARKPSSSSS